MGEVQYRNRVNVKKLSKLQKRILYWMLQTGKPLEDLVQEEVELREKQLAELRIREKQAAEAELREKQEAVIREQWAWKRIGVLEAYSKGPEGWKEHGYGYEEPTNWDGRLVNSPSFVPNFGYDRKPSKNHARGKKSDKERAALARSVTRLCNRDLMVRLWGYATPYWLLTSDGIEAAKWLEWFRDGDHFTEV